MSTATLHYGPRRESTGAWVGVSIGFHVLMIATAWWFSRDTGPRIDLDAKPIQAHLVRQGEVRDEKLLPRMDPNTPPPEPEAVAIPEKPSPSIPEPKKPTPKPQPKHDINKDLFSAFDKSKPVHADKVTGQADGDPSGDVDNASEGERYYGIISSRVKRNYDVSSAIPDAERVRLVATVILYIDAGGRVTRADFQAKSGNDLFDTAVMSAVHKAGPFPPPPQFLVSQLASGVALKFRP